MGGRKIVTCIAKHHKTKARISDQILQQKEWKSRRQFWPDWVKIELARRKEAEEEEGRQTFLENSF